MNFFSIWGNPPKKEPPLTKWRNQDYKEEMLSVLDYFNICQDSRAAGISIACAKWGRKNVSLFAVSNVYTEHIIHCAQWGTNMEKSTYYKKQTLWKIWSVSPELFMEQKSLISEECCGNSVRKNSTLFSDFSPLWAQSTYLYTYASMYLGAYLTTSIDLLLIFKPWIFNFV